MDCITIIITLEGIEKIKTKKQKTTKQSEEYFLHQHCKAPSIWRKVVPGKRVTLPAASTLASVYMRKTFTPLPESRAGRVCSDRLALTELTRLGAPKCLYGEKLARLEG